MYTVMYYVHFENILLSRIFLQRLSNFLIKNTLKSFASFEICYTFVFR